MGLMCWQCLLYDNAWSWLYTCFILLPWSQIPLHTTNATEWQRNASRIRVARHHLSSVYWWFNFLGYVCASVLSISICHKYHSSTTPPHPTLYHTSLSCNFCSPWHLPWRSWHFTTYLLTRPPTNQPKHPGAVGARTTESQLHRELASGCSFPIGTPTL